MQHHAALIYLAPLIGLVALGLAFAGIMLVMPRGGWALFAARYGTTSSAAPRGPVLVARGVRINTRITSYNNIVRLTVLPQGLRFSMPSLFAIGHRPFIVPWSDVTHARAVRGLLVTTYEMELENAAGIIRLRLSAGAQGVIEQVAPVLPG
jgi:hypothetical protein